jgi:hypothetical protein
MLPPALVLKSATQRCFIALLLLVKKNYFNNW